MSSTKSSKLTQVNKRHLCLSCLIQLLKVKKWVTDNAQRKLELSDGRVFWPNNVEES